MFGGEGVAQPTVNNVVARIIIELVESSWPSSSSVVIYCATVIQQQKLKQQLVLVGVPRDSYRPRARDSRVERSAR